MDSFVDNSILVTGTTDPDWVPVMRRAAAIITDHGGATSHAAIVSRELGLPAVVGTGNATFVLHGGQDVTVSCAEGTSGFVYDGAADITAETLDVSELPPTKTKIMLSRLSNAIQVHPMALIRFNSLRDETARERIAAPTAGYSEKPDYFVDKLSQGFATLCAAVYPRPAIIRMSDFKTNEYAGLVGGADFEPKEQNPMLGFRGASQYYSPRYREGFGLDCRTIKRLRDHMGFTNAVVMIPFCRTVNEAREVTAVMGGGGGGFADHFDGFSIGSNDLTQLTLGVDRDSGELAHLFDEQDEAVKWMLGRVISVAREKGRKIGICGQAPSDHP
ncbi:phosphoenolpyruvate synthase [Metarhizium album ARSEF 1941]|uniref:Phosphoenolpyruvate synthase n=1 Tax=Metarhizium album (strain ARSEF 1941) TaxID=1081103 RepID=A0A0B2WW31_METAS|nr:phosphoenolpyruvate synthase [Metarhizium album ARSEF 1941]KHO00392.1 phosphoenolpyruvate synthase [Metarhizium album ARSEF 1941]